MTIDILADAKRLIKLSNPWHFLATGFGIGMFPYMPGTIGSLVAIPIWFLLLALPCQFYFLTIIFSFFIGIYFCHKTELDIGIHDHGCIVWDEFIGMWITLMVLPENNWCLVLIGFFLFRLFDTWKPWPIRWFDHKVYGGIGIIIDDIIAGSIASSVLYWIRCY
ncbi:Phosphatidylglycerophosphatase A [Candidatus Gullanella endobia]|uniref:Phosphatidylglycerophosphatase A n=1 Tax=Candidatus Gullanella endobia TaxID=1070130 RepID=A0A143WQK8_9ENTR|nr:phosphatidylglycerophosphatase A [Candidatus Gullanella endobia]CUX95837.1 Phosphatidylglycerophosphatase A [Candidatus Gullanella endobia]